MQRTALVTGGNQGLGKAIAIELQARGYRVALLGHGAVASDFTAATSIPVFDWDSADVDACHSGIAAVEQAIGAIDILVNYAGAGHDAQRWPQGIDASVGAMLNMSRSVVDKMRSRRFGRIVNIGPICSPLDCQPDATVQLHQRAARDDLLALTRSLALTAAPDHVTVNAIMPGCCEDAPGINIAPDTLQANTVAGNPVAGTPVAGTPVAGTPVAGTPVAGNPVANTPVGRFGTPQDISRTVAFLIDDDAGFITGASIDVDGGFWLSQEAKRTVSSDDLGTPTAADIGLDWASRMTLGAPDIDHAHQAFIAQLGQLLSAPDDAFESGLHALIVAMETDFRQEEALMEEIDFPGIRMHREQHARVLSALHHVVPQVMQGDHAQARKAIELIPQWFMLHLTTMDAAMVVALELANLPAAGASRDAAGS
jgi:acetoacetyl-CoA reductase